MSTRSVKSSHRRSRTAKDTSSKADAARAIFARMNGKKPRKDIVEAFVNTVGLTPAGASTYYQRFSNPDHVRARGKASNKTSLRSSRSARPRGRPIDEESKAGKARAIFRRMSGKNKSRKEILEAFQKEAKLTAAGSSTYYQKMKNAA